MQIKKFVIAGNYHQARQWAGEQGLHLKDWLYVNGPWSLRGYAIDRSQIVYVGTFAERSDIRQIREAVVQAVVRGEARDNITRRIIDQGNEAIRARAQEMRLEGTAFAAHKVEALEKDLATMRERYNRKEEEAGQMRAERDELRVGLNRRADVLTDTAVELWGDDPSKSWTDIPGAVEELMTEVHSLRLKVADLEEAITELKPVDQTPGHLPGKDHDMWRCPGCREQLLQELPASWDYDLPPLQKVEDPRRQGIKPVSPAEMARLEKEAALRSHDTRDPHCVYADFIGDPAVRCPDCNPETPDPDGLAEEPTAITIHTESISDELFALLYGQTKKDATHMYSIPKTLFTLTDGTKVNKGPKGYALVLKNGETKKAHTIRVHGEEFQAYDRNWRLVHEGRVS